MKPSIFIMTKYKLINLNEFSNDQIYLDKLDKRFIDREELKDKINKKILKISLRTESPNYRKIDYKIDNQIIKELKDILELLKWMVK